MSFMQKVAKNYLLVILVIVPAIFSMIYYGLFAADQYVSESRFVVKSQGRQQPQISTLANLIQTTGISPGLEQTREVLSYIKSRSALGDLSKEVDVKAMYEKPQGDFLSRYPIPWRSDRFENLFRYYDGMIEAHVDSSSGLAILTVRAFSAEDAHKLNSQLLNLSERLVNRLNEKAREKAISESRTRVAEAEVRVRNARVSLNEYRNERRLLDPMRQAEGVLEVSTRLVTERASLQAQLDVMARSAPGNPALPALRRRVEAIDREIAAQDGRAVGTRSGIASKLGEYEKRALEQEFAAENLTVANAALEQARTEAQRQQFYLERVVEPNAPDLARLPNRIAKILTVIAGGLCLYLISWMLIVGILEHAPES